MSAIDHLEAFNGRLINLARDVQSRLEGNADVADVVRRLRIAIDTCPVRVIDEVGCYLARHYKAIVDHDSAFFLDGGIAQDLRGADETTLSIVKALRDAYRGLPDTQRHAYFEVVNDLLYEFLEYSRR
jgi:hypothetical protein